MRVGLIDVDGHHFPNLVLMKLCKWHRVRGDDIEFVRALGKYDIVYKSKVFTYTRDDPLLFYTDKILIGGTGYKDYSINLPDEIEHSCPDYSLYDDYRFAYGFLTRGCPNSCPWCIVPSKEGRIHAHADITEFIDDRKAVILLDNNVLGCDHGIRQLEKIIDLKLKIDLTQGIDARLITSNTELVNLLSRIRWIRFIRMAADTSSMLPVIENVVDLFRKQGIKPYRIFCYVLIKDTEEALSRIMFLKKLGVIPFAQPYRDFHTNTPPSLLQKQLARWCNHKAIFNSITFQQYLKSLL